jgi:penicillin-binding protein 2
VYFYMIGGGYQEVRGLGPNKIIEWLGKFGWNQTTGIDLPNEGKGVLPEINQNWRLGNTYHLSIGQGHFSVTPLQVAVAYAALANGGVLYQPQVVNQIIRQMNGAQVVVREFTPIVANPSVASYENIKIVQEGMRQAVTSPQGSTYLLNGLPVTSAAKTGTAQTGRDNVYHNWIALFAPYEDPELVMVFMIRDVHDSMVAVRSVAYDVLDLYFSGKNDKFSQNQEP